MLSDISKDVQLQSVKRNSLSNVKVKTSATIEPIYGTMGSVRLHKVEYGSPSDFLGKRLPVVMIRARLGEDVYNRFLNQPLFQCKDPKQLQEHHIHYAVDYPKSVKTHFYYEGYFHALGNTSSSVWSRNARTGHEFSKPSTTTFVRAFYESFRRINFHIFNELKLKLYQNALTRNQHSPLNDICGLVSSWIDSKQHFSDLSIQMHHGSHIQQNELFWHNDAENSLLHVGITVHGHRILHSKRASSEDGDVMEVLESQTPGDVYISSPALMNHAPEFPASTWNESRIIAIQSRILYSSAQLKTLRQMKTPASWYALASVVSDVLSRADVKLPDMASINSVIAEWSKHQRRLL